MRLGIKIPNSAPASIPHQTKVTYSRCYYMKSNSVRYGWLILGLATSTAVTTGCEVNDDEGEPRNDAWSADASQDVAVVSPDGLQDAALIAAPDALTDVIDAFPGIIDAHSIDSEAQPRLRIWAGALTTCVERFDKSIWCWGEGSTGELGNGQAFSSIVPVRATAWKEPIHDLFLNLGRVCAINSAGDLYCLGFGIGNAPVKKHSFGSKPVSQSFTITGMTDCVIDGEGVPWCWGQNNWGQAGNQLEEARPDVIVIPDTVTVPTKAVAFGSRLVRDVAVAYGTSCALIVDGTVRCVGENGNTKKLGRVLPEKTFLSLEVPDIGNDILAIEAAGLYFCVRKQDKSVWCWGGDYSGHTGSESEDEVAPPIKLNTNQEFQQLALGGDSACGLATDSTVWCWGYGGALGIGATNGRFPVPQRVSGLKNVRSVSAGFNHVCAVTRDEQIYCWGSNERGQIGNINSEYAYTPVRVDTFLPESN